MHVATRHRPQGGFSFIEILVVMGIIALLASLVVGVIPLITDRAARAKSQDNFRQLGIMMQAINSNISQWPPYNGKNFVLAPLAHGVHDEDAPGALEVFFSTSDSNYKASKVEIERYKGITKQKLKNGDDFHELTSYAGRRNNDGKEYVLTSSDTTSKGLICFSDDDDGALHHEGGLIVGFANGRADFLEWDELGFPKPKDVRSPEPFLGESATTDLLRMLSSSR